jgi:hypothetical protein
VRRLELLLDFETKAGQNLFSSCLSVGSGLTSLSFSASGRSKRSSTQHVCLLRTGTTKNCPFSKCPKELLDC